MPSRYRMKLIPIKTEKCRPRYGGRNTRSNSSRDILGPHWSALLSTQKSGSLTTTTTFGDERSTSSAIQPSTNASTGLHDTDMAALLTPLRPFPRAFPRYTTTLRKPYPELYTPYYPPIESNWPP